MQPRAVGEVRLSVKTRQERTVIDQFRHSGSMKCLFPRTLNDTQAVLVNTAGGVTGGDRFDTTVQLASHTGLTITTQACERAYRAQQGQAGSVTSRIKIAPEARLNWLPQETILFDGSALKRSLIVDVAENSRCLICEPLVLGRAAMGEQVRQGYLKDRIEIRRDGLPLYLDVLKLDGDLQAHLNHSQIGAGAQALANLIFVAPEAEAHLKPLREMMTATSGVTLIQDGVLALRMLASDSFTLRQSLIPILHRLNGGPLPRCWMI